MNGIKFSDIKTELQAALGEKLKQTPILGEAGFTLIDGFMTLSLNGELSNNLIIGGPSIPTVGIVGNTSGRIYTFALKVILPNIKI
ncbi:MAG: hypothetical protein QG568_408 [Patescibacteria group bacterium]|nr:hypothetical protein [Patescibacteria group bacterium]